uniref:CARD domain-containing protein n=1 Tax=Anolis carolinensis TaxID=28377 RepID=A0A803SUI9_ANOCA
MAFETIRRERENLIAFLERAPGLILDDAASQGFISETDYNDLDKLQSSNEKMRKLLVKIQLKGEEICHRFLEGIRSIFPDLPAALWPPASGELMFGRISSFTSHIIIGPSSPTPFNEYTLTSLLLPWLSALESQDLSFGGLKWCQTALIHPEYPPALCPPPSTSEQQKWKSLLEPSCVWEEHKTANRVLTIPPAWCRILVTRFHTFCNVFIELLGYEVVK